MHQTLPSALIGQMFTFMRNDRQQKSRMNKWEGGRKGGRKEGEREKEGGGEKEREREFLSRKLNHYTNPGTQ